MKKIIVLLYVSLFVVSIKSQSIEIPKYMLTPNASDLGKYAEIPVSYYTGRANVTIPLYELEVRGISMPINMTYDTSGIMMNSLPSWTGHNWTIEAGGVITRTINYLPDEYIPPVGAHLSHPQISYFQDGHKCLKRLMDSQNYNALRDSARNGHIDLSPDIFYFNFMGKRGRFFLGHDGHWKVCSDDNIEVIFDINDNNNYIEPFINHFPDETFSSHQPQTIKGFLLIDEKGTKYYFGGRTNAIEYTLNFYGMSDLERVEPWNANSWYLTKVEDRYGNDLYDLYYTRGKFMVHFSHFNYSFFYQNYSNAYGISASEDYLVSNSSFPYIVMFNAPVYLEKIAASNGQSIEFFSSDLKIPLGTLYPSLASGVYKQSLYEKLSERIGAYDQWQYYYLQTNDSDVTPYQYRSNDYNQYTDPLEFTCLRMLNYIDLYHQEGGRRYEFQYSLTSRMHMTGIKIIGLENEGADEREYGSYSFSYNFFSSIPNDYLSNKTDHWGYYTVNDDKEPNPNYPDIGMLRSITYPTKGETRFEYEQNSYDYYLSSNRQNLISESGYAGGLRIKSIKEYESGYTLQLIRERNFTYGDIVGYIGVSSGQLFAKPQYSWPQQTVYSYGGVEIKLTRYQESSVIPLLNSFGPHIGYSYVCESRNDGTYTTYHYTNFADYKDELPVYSFLYSWTSPNEMFNERGYRRGRLLDYCVYDTNNDTIQIVRNIYRTDNIEQKYVYASNMYNVVSGVTAAPFQYVEGYVYKLYYPKYDIIQTKTTNYYDNGTVTDIVNYNKQDIELPIYINNYRDTVDIRKTMQETLQRGSNLFVTNYAYPNSSTITIEKNLATNHFYLMPIKTEHSYNGTLIKTLKTGFKDYNGKTVPAYDLELKRGLYADTLIHYLTYTPTWQIASYKEFGQPVTYLQWMERDNYLQSKTIGQMTTQYFYNSDYRISRIVNSNGYSLYYDYDGMGRLEGIRDNEGHQMQKFEYHYKE